MQQMTRTQRGLLIGGAGMMLFLLAGCSGYYQITDPNAARLYFTRSLTVDSRTADLIMEDDLRDQEVRLSEYEVKQLSRDEYRRATQYLRD
jgi:hypothetical protein